MIAFLLLLLLLLLYLYVCICFYNSYAAHLLVSIYVKNTVKKKKRRTSSHIHREKKSAVKKIKKKEAVVIYIYLYISISSYVHLFQKKKTFVVLKRKAKKLFFLFSAFSRKRKRSAHSWVSFFKKASCKTVCITPPLSVQPMKTKDRYCEHHWWKRSST